MTLLPKLSSRLALLPAIGRDLARWLVRGGLAGAAGCALLLPAQAREATPEAPLLALQAADPARSVTLVELIRRTAPRLCRQDAPDLLRCTGPLRLEGLQDLRIDGQGMQLEFQSARPNGGGLRIFNASNVVLSNFRVRWAGGGVSDPPAADGQRVQTLARVEACTGQQRGGALRADWPLQGDYPIGAISTWDERTGWPWRSSDDIAVDIYLPDNTTTRFERGLSGCLPQLVRRVGDRVLVRHHIYTNHAIRCANCSRVTIEQVKVHSAPGMAFLFNNGGRHLLLRNNQIGPACLPRCERPEPSITADGSHFAGVQGPVRISGNDFGWQGDDSVNVTGQMMPARIEADGWVRPLPAMVARLRLFEPGAPVLLFDSGMNLLGSASVLAEDEAGQRLRLAQLPGGLRADPLIVVPQNRMPRGIEVVGNHFHDHRARGILMGGSDALIEDNTIERVTMAAILLIVDTRHTFEGPGAQRVTIRRNRVSDVNRYATKRLFPSAISAGLNPPEGYAGPVGTPIRDITVEANQLGRIHHLPETPVSFGAGSAGRVK